MSVNIFKNGILSKIAGAVGDAVPLINNFLTNQSGKGAADANTVYVLNNKIEELNSSLEALKTNETHLGNCNSDTEITLSKATTNYKRIRFVLVATISGNFTIPIDEITIDSSFIKSGVSVYIGKSFSDAVKCARAVTFTSTNKCKLGGITVNGNSTTFNYVSIFGLN